MTLAELYEARLDSTRSINYYGEFDCFCESVFFSLCDGDTGEALKTYEVSFDEDTGEIDHDVEFTSWHDSGYCDFKRLPKSVREHVLAIVNAYIEEQAEENARLEASEEAEENDLNKNPLMMNTLREVDTKDFTIEQKKAFIEGWESAGGFTEDFYSPARWACPWTHGNTKIKVFGNDLKSWGAQWWNQNKKFI